MAWLFSVVLTKFSDETAVAPLLEAQDCLLCDLQTLLVILTDYCPVMEQSAPCFSTTWTLVFGQNIAVDCSFCLVQHLSHCSLLFSPQLPQTMGARGALQYFRYRVCATGQGIIFTIPAPKPGIFLCKNAPNRVYNFQIFALRQDDNGNFAPR